MNAVDKLIVTLLFTLAVLCTGNAQYFGEQVMEKSFEQTDFFFTPYKLLPFGLGNFRNSVSGVLNDPLINLELNPSYMYCDSIRSGYLYLDFRSSKEIQTGSNTVYPLYYDYRTSTAASSIVYPYPYYYINTRKELEPVISAAYLYRPVEGSLKDLSLGISYQMISQDEDYYAIPQDIYRSVIGSNYGGVRTMEAGDIPVVDKYSGTDDISQRGHFIALFAGYELDSRLRIGTKLSRVTFDREGELGSKNMWEYNSSNNNASLWSNNEGRSQDYKHWEVTVGANYRIDECYEVGVTAGRLWGNADQVLARGDSSYWSSGLIGSTTQNWNLYSSSGRQRYTWNHDGRTNLAGADLKMHLNREQIVQVHYLFTRQHTDIVLGGSIVDTSFGSSRYQWDTTVTTSQSFQRLVDHRTGTGTSVVNSHRLVGSLQWQISPTINVSIGAQYENRRVQTNTSERVIADRHYRNASTGRYAYNYFDSTAEAKTLAWDFSSKLSRFTIPIFLTVHASDVVELLFGLNRSMSQWEITDVTLATFDYRVNANLNGVSRNQNFGERYTLPKERVSDVRTTFLAGLTVSPSNVFNVRLLVVPNFVDRYEGTELSELQWWIGVNLRP